MGVSRPLSEGQNQSLTIYKSCASLFQTRRRERPVDAARISKGYAIRGNVPGNHASRSDNGPIPDRNSRADNHRASQPDVVPDRNGFRKACLSAFRGIDRMRRRVDLHIRSYPATLADRNLRRVENRTAVIDKRSRTDKDVLSRVAKERRFDMHRSVPASEQIPETFLAKFEIFRRRGVQPMKDLLAGKAHFQSLDGSRPKMLAKDSPQIRFAFDHRLFRFALVRRAIWGRWIFRTLVGGSARAARTRAGTGGKRHRKRDKSKSQDKTKFLFHIFIIDFFSGKF